MGILKYSNSNLFNVMTRGVLTQWPGSDAHDKMLDNTPDPIRLGNVGS